MRRLQPLIFVLPVLGFFLWSFVLTDRSLIYSSFSPFVAFQNFLWSFASNRFSVVTIYLFLLAGMFYLHSVVLQGLKKGKFILGFGVAVLVLLLFALSNPALSYDLFNYMFDAKLVIQYHLDPHVTSAITFADRDDWVRFMRNIFFPTTYGYAWTALILVPFVLGLGKFLLVFIAFKLYALIALGLLFLLARSLYSRLGIDSESKGYRLALFFASPFVLIEGLSSAHNDIWMMVFAFASLVLLLPGNWMLKAFKLTNTSAIKIGLQLVFSFGLLYVSSQIKRSTALLLPVWSLFALGLILPKLQVPSKIRSLFTKVSVWWADIAAVLLFIPLFTDLSRQFHPWYLLWSFSFLPFVRSTILRTVLIIFSITSLLRYVPVLYLAQYSVEIEIWQKMITWSAIPIAAVILLVMLIKKAHKV
jgi:hypothetical protein